MTYEEFSPEQIHVCCALIQQAQMATGFGGSPFDVTTVITRPLWNLFCIFSKIPANSEPTEWLGLEQTRRVWGTRTIVVESDHFAAVSFKPSLTLPTFKPTDQPL